MLRIDSKGVVRVHCLFIALCLWCCTAGCDPIPSEHKDFFNLPLEQRHEQMKSFPTDKQIEYFLADETYSHPSHHFGGYVAKRGKEAVPLLVKRLKEEDKEFLQVSILDVLEEINMYYYNLKDEKEALKTMREVVARMKNSQHKAIAEQHLESILGQQMLVPKKQ